MDWRIYIEEKLKGRQDLKCVKSMWDSIIAFIEERIENPEDYDIYVGTEEVIDNLVGNMFVMSFSEFMNQIFITSSYEDFYELYHGRINSFDDIDGETLADLFEEYGYWNIAENEKYAIVIKEDDYFSSLR